ncbi:MAG: Ku protein [Solirubrobacteraceae bacterium]|nr:MAG: Ku protein [Solirubrobacterales bacterium]
MPRAIWTGAISFGLVNVPVKLYSAVNRKAVRFHQLNGEDGVRIQQKRVDPTTGEEVPYENIVKGYEIAPDRYVVVSPEELDALDPAATRTIDIDEFVDMSQIDPIYFDHPYYLAPATGGAKAYRLLLDAMRDSGKIALARMVLRSKQHLAAVRPTGDVLSVVTMLYPDEVVDPDAIDELPEAAETEASERELKMAQQLIASLSGEFDPSAYRDEYRDKVLELIERKAAGEEIAVQPEAPPAAPVPDLMAALEASIQAARGHEAPAKPAKPPAGSGKRAPGKSAKAGANGRTSGSGTRKRTPAGGAKKS